MQVETELDKEKLLNWNTQVTDDATKDQINGIILSPELLFADLAPKICVVCGDKALSCNFGAITCESCKAFFRRNAHKYGKMKVKCIGACDVQVQNRSRCKRCRLQKCIEKGMKKNLILSDEQKIERKRKIEINKQRKCTPLKDQTKQCGDINKPNRNDEMTLPLKKKVLNSDSTYEHPGSEGPALSASKAFIYHSSTPHFSSENHRNGNGEQDDIYQVCPNTESGLPMTYLNMQSCGSLDSSPNEYIQSCETSPTSHNNTSEWSNIGYKSNSECSSPMSSNCCAASPLSSNGYGLSEQINSQEKLTTLNDSTNKFVPPFSCPLYGKCITSEILFKLDPDIAQIFSEMSAAFANSFDQPLKKNVTQYPTSVGWINQCEIGVEVLVKMAKKLPSFSSFVQDDQIILLKGAIIDMLICQSLRAFDDNNMRFVIPDCNRQSEGNGPTFSTLNKTNGEHPAEFQKMVTYYVDFFRMFKKASKGELNILMCVIVLMLFTPRENFPCKNSQGVVHWFHTYLRALNNLIEVLYPSGDLKIDNIMKSLETMKLISSAFQTNLKQATPHDLSPLIAEMFDICV